MNRKINKNYMYQWNTYQKRSFSEENKSLPISTNLTLSSCVRTDSFFSRISLKFKDLLCNVVLFKAFINAGVVICRPLTQANTVVNSAVGILLLLPLTLLCLSTRFVQALQTLNKEYALPAYVWQLVNHYSLQVVIPIVQNRPGLRGDLELVVPDSCHNNLGTYLVENIFTNENLVLFLDGTPFSSLAINKSDGKGSTKPFIRPELRHALDTACLRFDQELWTPQFIDELDIFFSRFNSTMYAPLTIIKASCSVSTSTNFGPHKFRNATDTDVFFAQFSAIESYSSEVSQTTLVCFLKLFSPLFTFLSNTGTYEVSGKYCSVSGDVVLDLVKFNYYELALVLLAVKISTPNGALEVAPAVRDGGAATPREIKLAGELRNCKKEVSRLKKIVGNRNNNQGNLNAIGEGRDQQRNRRNDNDNPLPP